MNDRSPFHWKYVHTLIGHTANVNSIAIDRGSSTLASCSDDKTIRLWDVKTGKHIFTFFGQTKAVFSVAFNPQIPLLASGGLEGTISTWNLEKKSSVALVAIQLLVIAIQTIFCRLLLP